MSAEHPPNSEPTNDRRAFITKAGVGTAAAGALWIAPSILTHQGAAFASCTGNTSLVWSADANNGRGPGDFTVGTGAGAVTVTVAGNQNGVPTGTGPGPSPFTATATQFGGANSSWFMQMAPTAVADVITTTFTFSQSVLGLSFPVYDIDSYLLNLGPFSARWQDRVTVTAVNAATVAQNVGVSSTGTPALAGGGTTSASATGVGSVNIGPESNTGNVQFSFATAVKTVTIAFNNPNTPGNRLPTTPAQYIGIGNLTWTSCP